MYVGASTVLTADISMQGSRYDGQIGVFGRTVQRKLEDLKVFLVGAGALGCEFAKNLAMMGVSSGSMGKITMTDDDVIEKSNLSRQFLFRDWNIGRLTSNVLHALLKSCTEFSLRQINETDVVRGKPQALWSQSLVVMPGVLLQRKVHSRGGGRPGHQPGAAGARAAEQSVPRHRGRL